ncbi:hypothetical protein ACHQM5_029189 [Ranunculus cassubicifolius]
MTGRGVVGDKWSNRILWLCAGTDLGLKLRGLWMVGVEKQAQNRERALRAAMESGADADDGEE